MIDAEKAQDMVVKLSDYLRYTVSQAGNNLVTLQKEIENINRYLDIEKVRFGGKLQYLFNIPERALGLELPAMLLQPLFENAIKHGVYESTEPITITTNVFTFNDSMVVEIENNYQKGTPMRKGEGIGLRNISERLKLEYKNEKLLKVKDENGLFKVTVIIPFKNEYNLL